MRCYMSNLEVHQRISQPVGHLFCLPRHSASQLSVSVRARDPWRKGSCSRRQFSRAVEHGVTMSFRDLATFSAGNVKQG